MTSVRRREPDHSPAPANIARALGQAAARCKFSAPVHHVYNPVDYAFEAHCQYLERFCRREAEILLVGMNPGPFGMVQTGVPFGEVSAVRDWLGITDGVNPPRRQHPKRPVAGFSCTRSEVSGQRLWVGPGAFWITRCFLRRFFVWNYCPLAFLEASGRNRTPDKLPQRERAPLYQACDRGLATSWTSCNRISSWASDGTAKDAPRVLGGTARIGHILHPSPASPAANRGWASQVEGQLSDLGIELP